MADRLDVVVQCSTFTQTVGIKFVVDDYDTPADLSMDELEATGKLACTMLNRLERVRRLMDLRESDAEMGAENEAAEAYSNAADLLDYLTGGTALTDEEVQEKIDALS